jgi:hypothetical protein
VAGLARFLRSNLTRQETIAIGTWYLGQFYPFSLPWHNTLVLTVATLPLGLLLLAAVGIGRAIRAARRDPFGMLILINAAMLLALRATPSAPGHDGVRQFVTAFVFLGILAALGVWTLAAWVRRGAGWYRVAAAALVLLLVVAGLGQSVLIHPYELAYYGEAVGSLPGARALGLETTYYWDTLSPATLAWMNARSDTVKFSFPNYVRGWAKLHEWHMLSDRVTFGPLSDAELRQIRALAFDGKRLPPAQVRPYDYYVVQMRQATFQHDGWSDRAIVDKVGPCFSVRRFGVELLAVYRFGDLPVKVQDAQRKVQLGWLRQVETGQLGGPAW